MPALELQLCLRSEVGGPWILQVTAATQCVFLEDRGDGTGSKPMQVEFEESTCVVIGLHKRAKWRYRKSDQVTPLSSVSFSLTLNDFSEVCQTLGATKRFTPFSGLVLTVSVRLPRDAHAKDPTHQEPADDLRSLQHMGAKKKKLVTTLMAKIQDTGDALDAAEKEKRNLEDKKSMLLTAQGQMTKTLDDMCTPFLTDLDFDLLMSIEGGVGKMMHLMYTARGRLEHAQNDVLEQWKRYEGLQPSIQDVHALEKRIREVEEASQEQASMVTVVKGRYEECSRLRSVVHTQQASIERMEKTALRWKDGASWERKLEMIKEKTDHDRLEQLYQQVSMDLPETTTSHSALKSQLSIQNEQLDKRRMDLLCALETRYDSSTTSNALVLHAEKDAKEACQAFRTQYGCLLGRKEAFEGKIRQQGLEFTTKVVNLKKELADRDSELESLRFRKK